MKETFEIPLDIPDVRIIKTEMNATGDFIITVESTVEGSECHRCGRRITKPYGHDRDSRVPSSPPIWEEMRSHEQSTCTTHRAYREGVADCCCVV
jgi:transposase